MNTNRPDPDNDFEDINTDEENPDVHDQLPSPEEYKAKMKDGNTFGSSRDVDDEEYGEQSHDLPSVSEYKTNMSFREDSDRPKSRAGLYTFLCLVLLLIIITA